MNRLKTISLLLVSLFAIQANAQDPMSEMMDSSMRSMFSVFDMFSGTPKSVGQIMEEDDEPEVSSMVAFTVEKRALIKSGDPFKGKEIAEKERCAKCHGDNGVAEDMDDPNIAGQTRSYAYKQLMDYKNGHRDERSMRKAVRKLSEEDMVHLAAYYESLPAPPSMLKDEDGVAFQLVYKGDPERMIKPCATCHGQNAEGGQHDSAALVGPSLGYFVTAMEEFKEGDRVNDIYSRMRLVAEQLTDDEIEALANYYATEPPPEDDE